jgi:hypothetical protein
MSDEFILFVGDTKFLLGLNEAMQIATVLNSAQRVGTEWLKDVPQGRNHVLKRPHLMSAVVAPMTAIFRMELETNQRVLDEKK